MPSEGAAPASSTAATADPASGDPALAAACGEFWGDPEYTDPLSRLVLDRAGTAAENGASDPLFYAMTGDDIDLVFEDAPTAVQDQVAPLAEWFRSEPEKGEAVDMAAFEAAWAGTARACESTSDAASWVLQPSPTGREGTKPAALVCADVFDTPSTLTPFANANVLTSNMFTLVGLSPRHVPAEGMDLVRATDEWLTAQISAADDEAVAAALEEVRAPFVDAIEGDAWSEGLQEPLESLSAACDAAGYAAPGPMGAEEFDADEGEGLV